MSVGYDVTETIEAENTFTDWIQLSGKGKFTLSIQGLSDSTVTLQRAHNPADPDNITAGETEDVQTYTESTDPVKRGEDPAYRTFYRAGIKTGDYGSDTVVIILRS